MRLIFVNQLPLDYFRNSENGLVCIRSSLTVHALPIYVLCVRIKSMSFRPLSTLCLETYKIDCCVLKRKVKLVVVVNEIDKAFGG